MLTERYEWTENCILKSLYPLIRYGLYHLLHIYRLLCVSEQAPYCSGWYSVSWVLYIPGDYFLCSTFLSLISFGQVPLFSWFMCFIYFFFVSSGFSCLSSIVDVHFHDAAGFHILRDVTKDDMVLMKLFYLCDTTMRQQTRKRERKIRSK